MTVYRIDSFDGDDGGLDFGEFWDDPTLVSAAVTKLAAVFQPALCYCMRLKVVHGTRESTFIPYAGTGLPSGPIDPLPAVKFSKLLLDDERWPVLGRWIRGQSEPKHPPQLANGHWHGEVRIKAGKNYVGFLKAVVNQMVSDDVFQVAYREVKGWLDRQVAKRRMTAIWDSPLARENLQKTRADVARELKDENRNCAIYRLAALITSHLGAGFNRIACLLPDLDGTLICVHAHGGDCSDEWARTVQSDVVREATTIDELQDRLALQMPPVGDPLYRELVATGPLRIANNNSLSVIRRIWETKGKLDELPDRNQVFDEPEVDFAADERVFLSEPCTIAARFRLEEPSAIGIFPVSAYSTVNASQNGCVFVLPWTLDGRVVGLWLLDLGQWSRFDERCDVVPRLESAKGILREFSTVFVDFI